MSGWSSSLIFRIPSSLTAACESIHPHPPFQQISNGNGQATGRHYLAHEWMEILTITSYPLLTF